MVAVDRAGNQARCHFQVVVKPTPCVDWELTKPSNGDLVCLENGGGYECIATCETGYR